MRPGPHDKSYGSYRSYRSYKSHMSERPPPSGGGSPAVPYESG
jgi:hypothetical protein